MIESKYTSLAESQPLVCNWAPKRPSIVLVPKGELNLWADQHSSRANLRQTWDLGKLRSSRSSHSSFPSVVLSCDKSLKCHWCHMLPHQARNDFFTDHLEKTKKTYKDQMVSRWCTNGYSLSRIERTIWTDYKWLLFASWQHSARLIRCVNGGVRLIARTATHCHQLCLRGFMKVNPVAACPKIFRIQNSLLHSGHSNISTLPASHIQSIMTPSFQPRGPKTQTWRWLS